MADFFRHSNDAKKHDWEMAIMFPGAPIELFTEAPVTTTMCKQLVGGLSIFTKVTPDAWDHTMFSRDWQTGNDYLKFHSDFQVVLTKVMLLEDRVAELEAREQRMKDALENNPSLAAAIKEYDTLLALAYQVSENG